MVDIDSDPDVNIFWKKIRWVERFIKNLFFFLVAEIWPAWATPVLISVFVVAFVILDSFCGYLIYHREAKLKLKAKREGSNFNNTFYFFSFLI